MENDLYREVGAIEARIESIAQHLRVKGQPESARKQLEKLQSQARNELSYARARLETAVRLALIGRTRKVGE
jgi:ribosomal protein S15P/S13E